MNESYGPVGHTAATLCRPICTPSKVYDTVMQNYTHKIRTGITKKPLFSSAKTNTKTAWRSVGIQWPPDPSPFQP